MDRTADAPPARARGARRPDPAVARAALVVLLRALGRPRPPSGPPRDDAP